MNVDIIQQICVYNDYPILREHFKNYRDRVQKIILYPSRHHGLVDFEAFQRKMIPETWVEPVAIDYGREDWRQAETTPCLKYSDAEWIWFCEQDFFFRDWDKFYEIIEKEMSSADMIGWLNATHFPYIHPCCLFIKRELLEQTQKDFSAHPEINGCDHFAMLTKDAERLGAKITPIQSLVLDGGNPKEWVDCFHLGGLTYPYQNWGESRNFGVGRVPVFYVYNYWSRKAKVEQDVRYLSLSIEVEEELKRREDCQFDLEDNEWIKFFVLNDERTS